MADPKFEAGGAYNDVLVRYDRVKDHVPMKVATEIIEAWWGKGDGFNAEVVTSRGLDQLRLRIAVAVAEAWMHGREEGDPYAR